MRRRQLKWLWARLKKLAGHGRFARGKADEARRGAIQGAVRVASGQDQVDDKTGALTFSLDREKLRKIKTPRGPLSVANQPDRKRSRDTLAVLYPTRRRRRGFKNLKGDLAIRPIFHQDEERIEAHIFVAFLAYCLQITLTRRLHGLAPGLTARSALQKFAAVQMIDVHLPTTDGREIILTRYTEPEPELSLLLERMKLSLPPQPPPKIAAAALPVSPSL